MLRIVAPVARVGEQAAFGIPIFLLDRPLDRRGRFAVAFPVRGYAESLLHVGGRFESHDKQQVLERGIAVLLAERLSRLEIRCPVAEKPVRHECEREILFQKAFVPRQHSPVCRQKRFQVFLLAPVVPIVVSHAYPIERERRDELVNARRVAAHRDAVRHDRLAALFDGIARHVPVARIVERNERLNPRVAEILQLFVVGTVHVGLVRAQACRPPADVEHAVQLRMSRCVER